MLEFKRLLIFFLFFLAIGLVSLYSILPYPVVSTSSKNEESSFLHDQTRFISGIPSRIKTSIIRLLVSNEISLETIKFDWPTNNKYEDGYILANYNEKQMDLSKLNKFVESGKKFTFYYNANFQVPGIGEQNSFDLVAYAPYLTKEACSQVNAEIGIEDIPTFNVPESDKQFTTSITSKGGLYGTFPTNAQPFLSIKEFTGSKKGCFKENTLGYVYFQILIEQ